MLSAQATYEAQETDRIEDTIRFPYTLDTFQKQSIRHIQRGEHVLVAAHTSAGKSTVAEFGVNWCLKNEQRVIYTAPIKALSNQKFADFRQKAREGMFDCLEDEIGIITGDVQNNPDGKVIIATTEIIHNYLYTNAAYFDDVGIVVFDEVHYINDPERGKVWEGSIVMMPEHVTLVMLSATIPKADRFADWIRRVKAPTPVGLVTTDYRPVPLHHYMFWDDTMHRIYDETGAHTETYESVRRSVVERHKAVKKPASRMRTSKAEPAIKQHKQHKPQKVLKPPSESHLLNRAVKWLEEEDKLPGFFFCFSRKKCHSYARSIQHPVSDGKTITKGVNRFRSLVQTHIQEEDRALPQIQEMERFVAKGVAVHHSGLLPILKEVVETLFKENYIKVLLVTETFAVGINLATRCVVLTDVRKHDGHGKRNLAAHEYQQISGRAGRRGLDTGGLVVLLPLQPPPLPAAEAYAMISGAKQPIRSRFELDAHFLLTAMQSESQTVKGVLESTLMAQEIQQQAAAITATEPTPKILEAGAQSLRQLQADAQFQEHSRLQHQMSKPHKQAKKARACRDAFDRYQHTLMQERVDEWKRLRRLVEDAAAHAAACETAATEKARLENEIAESARTVASMLHAMGCMVLPVTFDEIPNSALLAEWPAGDTLTIKGKVCAAFHECPPLLTTVWVMRGGSDKLSGEEIAMAMATLVGERPNEFVWALDHHIVPAYVQKQVNDMYELNQDIGMEHVKRRLRYATDSGVVAHMAEYAARWVAGESMASILQNATVPIDEGNFVRSMLKLFNMLEELRGVYAMLGHANEQKLVGVGPLVLRGTVRVDSLYF